MLKMREVWFLRAIARTALFNAGAASRGLRNTLQIVVPAQSLVATSSTTKISSSPPSLARTSFVGAAVNAAPPAEPYIQDVVLCSRMRVRSRLPSRVPKATLPVYLCSVPLRHRMPITSLSPPTLLATHLHARAFSRRIPVYGS
ncbi:hypothetical protein K438DRAFT_99210 [Mycena galopus ATCC 62051]|nr:hypothetical protein K438DRAFT_99210 [Mycena galopus ATCC 62051]